MQAARRQFYLREMGYTPLRQRAAAADPTEHPVSAPIDAVATPLPTAASPASKRPAASAAPTTQDPLWRVLLAAAAASEADVERLGWDCVLKGPAFVFDGPRLQLNPIALRQNPAAKRALWKTLRSLRRRQLERAR